MKDAALPRLEPSLQDISLEEAAALAWREAEHLDRHDYAPWLALWTENGRYVIPVERESEDYANSLNVVFDDAAMRDARVKRLLSGLAMSTAPSARTVRTVSRFCVQSRFQGGVEVRAAQIIVEYKVERTRVLAADVAYRIVRRGGDLALDQKVVRLINSDDALFGIGYLL